MLNLDIKKFLLHPVNNGKYFFNEENDCACLKGCFYRGLGGTKKKHIGYWLLENLDFKTLSILQRGESIHIGHGDYTKFGSRPTYAKLFVLRALRMAGLLPREEKAKELVIS